MPSCLAVIELGGAIAAKPTSGPPPLPSAVGGALRGATGAGSVATSFASSASTTSTSGMSVEDRLTLIEKKLDVLLKHFNLSV